MVRDPVCGMAIDPQKAAGSSIHQGQTYYFCSVGCKKAFDKHPEMYSVSAGHAAHEHVGHESGH